MRGAWIEITCSGGAPAAGVASLPVRGAWIEIAKGLVTVNGGQLSLPVRGAWIEMAGMRSMTRAQVGRSPCGERGLKCAGDAPGGQLSAVAPRAGLSLIHI